MAQAVWVGELGFGLVNVPVRLYGATAPKSVQFHHYEARSGRRIRYRRVAESPPHPAYEPEPEPFDDDPAGVTRIRRATPARTGAQPSVRAVDDAPDALPGDEDDAGGEVQWDDVVKGVEVEPGRVVTFERDELESIAPERSRVVEIEEFVDLRDIDPVHFDKSYYVVPQPGAGERAYWLLYRAMERGGKVAVGRFVMRTKEHLAAVRPGAHALVLHTMFYADEVRDPKDVGVVTVHEPAERELRLAQQFLDALAGRWEPDRHRDEHRDAVLELLRAKAKDARPAVERDDAAPAASELADLMTALTASVEAARRARHDDRGSST